MNNGNRIRAMKRLGAFTSVELLALIGVGGILGALVLAALAADKRIAQRAACAQNERELGLAWHMFAADHNGKVGITAPSNGGGWLWDMDLATRNTLTNQYQTPRKVFYCPSYTALNLDGYWNCAPCGGAFVGYWLLIQRVDFNFQPLQNWGNTMIGYAGDPVYHFVYDLSQSSDPDRPLQVLLTDAVLSDQVTGSFSNIFITLSGSVQSPHLGTNGVPEGSNLCYADGHVEWHDFSQLKRRWFPGPGSLVYDWW
jgi:prepilin-type processing-associated H-X9-DG protein